MVARCLYKTLPPLTDSLPHLIRKRVFMIETSRALPPGRSGGNMTRRMKIFAGGAVLVLALAVAAALAQGMHGHGGPMGMDEFGHGGGHMLRFYTKYLDLTTDQQAQI